MTVIKGNKTTHFVRPGSAQTSDTESLRLGPSSASGSDTESINNVPLAHPQRFVNKLKLLEEPLRIEKSTGRRKLQRYNNRKALQTLYEEEDDDATFMLIVEPYKSPFARLLEDSEALAYWNDFIEKCEEEQAEIISAFTEQYHKIQELPQKVNIEKGKVSSRIKRQFKTKKNLSLEYVRDCELQLLTFFSATPKMIYSKSAINSFDRLLIKAIAYYHGLEVKSQLEKTMPIEIFSSQNDWVPANCFLTDFIEKLR